jgi:allantoin racemase
VSVTGGPFRVRVVSPLEATEADLARRQRRYGAHAGPGTQVTVDNLAGGPAVLDTSRDVLESAAAIFRQTAGLTAAHCDAILIDCVFDPAVEELREATGLPVFGPTRATLPLATLVGGRFSIVARAERQCELLAETVGRYGFRPALRSLRALGLSYEEAKRPEIFEAAMCEQLRRVREDGADAVMFGSTTMALTDPMRQAAGRLPLFMPGLVALRVMEHLWRDGLWPRYRGARVDQ